MYANVDTSFSVNFMLIIITNLEDTETLQVFLCQVSKV